MIVEGKECKSLKSGYMSTRLKYVSLGLSVLPWTHKLHSPEDHRDRPVEETCLSGVQTVRLF